MRRRSGVCFGTGELSVRDGSARLGSPAFAGAQGLFVSPGCAGGLCEHRSQAGTCPLSAADFVPQGPQAPCFLCREPPLGWCPRAAVGHVSPTPHREGLRTAAPSPVLSPALPPAPGPARQFVIGAFS